MSEVMSDALSEVISAATRTREAKKDAARTKIASGGGRKGTQLILSNLVRACVRGASVTVLTGKKCSLECEVEPDLLDAKSNELTAISADGGGFRWLQRLRAARARQELALRSPHR